MLVYQRVFQEQFASFNTVPSRFRLSGRGDQKPRALHGKGLQCPGDFTALTERETRSGTQGGWPKSEISTEITEISDFFHWVFVCLRFVEMSAWLIMISLVFFIFVECVSVPLWSFWPWQFWLFCKMHYGILCRVRLKRMGLHGKTNIWVNYNTSLA